MGANFPIYPEDGASSTVSNDKPYFLTVGVSWGALHVERAHPLWLIEGVDTCRRDSLIDQAISVRGTQGF